MVTDSASLNDNRPIVESTRHDDIAYVWHIIDNALQIDYDDDNSEDKNLEILETACKTALKEIEKIKGTKYE